MPTEAVNLTQWPLTIEHWRLSIDGIRLSVQNCACEKVFQKKKFAPTSKYPSIKTKLGALWHWIEVKYIHYQWPSAFSKGNFPPSQLLYCLPERWQELPCHIEWCCFMIHQGHQKKSCFLAWNSLCPQPALKKQQKKLYNLWEHLSMFNIDWHRE